MLTALEAASGMLIASSLLLAPLVIHEHAFYSLTGPFNQVKLAILTEILFSSMGYLLFFKLIEQAGVVFL